MSRLFALLGDAALAGFGWLVLLYLVLPLAVLIGSSFTTTTYLQFPPEGLTWHWYAACLSDPSYLQALWLSATLAFIATTIALVLGVPASLVLVRSRFAGQQLVTALFLSPLVLPTIVLGAALLQYATALGFARTYTAMLLGHVVLVLPYIVRTTMATLVGFDASLEEAARDLGDTAVGAFLRVTLPAIKPGVIAGALFAVIISWVNVELSIFNTTASLMTLPVKLFNYIQYSVDPTLAAISAATIYVAVIVVVVIDIFVGLDKVATSARN